MRLYDILAALVDRTEEVGYRYVNFPGGFKACWGFVTNLSSGDTVTLPISFQDGVVAVLPSYNTGTTIRCIFPGEVLRNTNQFTAYAWDTETNAWSAANNLAIVYIAIGK